jgi:hypothetical protein
MDGAKAALTLIFAAAVVLGGTRPGAKDEPVAEPAYDAANVMNEIVSVVESREVPKGDALGGIHILVKSDSVTIDVFLGPTEFVKQFEFNVSKGDRVQVAGSKVKFRGADIILAREVRNQQMTLYLRDRKGVPNWSR